MADPDTTSGVRRVPVDTGHDLFDRTAVQNSCVPTPLVGFEARVERRQLADAVRGVMREHADLTVDGWRWKSWRDANPEDYAKARRDMLTETFGREVLDMLVYLAVAPIEDGTCSWDLNRSARETVGRNIDHGATVTAALIVGLTVTRNVRLFCILQRNPAAVLHPAFKGWSNSHVPS